MRHLVPRASALLIGGIVCLVSARPSAGQDSPLLLEVDVGAAIPLSSFADGTGTGEGTEAGVAFAVGFTVPRSDRFALHLGFGQQRFGCEPASCAEGGEYVATGFDLGLRIALLTGDHVVPWIRVDAVTTRVEARTLPEPDAGVSELGWGGKASVGVFVGTDWIGFSPSVSWAAVDTRLPGGDTLGLRYLTAGLGVVLPF